MSSGWWEQITACGTVSPQRGYGLDPRHQLPEGSLPPGVVATILQATAGFNPEAAFPQGSFPRAWPFVGGRLPPPPPPPPSRRLVIRKVGEKWKIVWRGEIPTVHVPRRADTGLPNETAVSIRPVPVQEEQYTRSDPARDPP